MSELPGNYDLPHLQSFHQFIFGLIYPWAGQVRTVPIAKSDLFCMPQYIHGQATTLFSQLQTDVRLHEPASRDDFVDALTYHLGEVNALHPFREGNGRAQRAFFAQVGLKAGFTIRWDLVDAERNKRRRCSRCAVISSRCGSCLTS